MDRFADVVLRSANGDDFPTSKFILTIASPFFESMFSLPQPDSEPSSSGPEPPIIDMSESTATLSLLLAFCHPRWLGNDPVPSSLESVQDLLDAALKYEMDGVASRARQLLLSPSFLVPEPIRVAAISCKYRWTHGLQQAALSFLCQPSPIQFTPELKYMTASQYHHLETYRSACADAAVARASESRWLACDDSFVWARCMDCAKYHPDPSRRLAARFLVYPQQRRWWMDCRTEYCAALRALPSGSTVMSPGLLKVAKERANSCQTCREHAADDLMRFGLIFSAEINEAIAKVDLEVCF